MRDMSASMDKAFQYRPLLWGVVAFFTLFFIWASLTDLDRHVRGTGRIVPAGNLRMIQHLEGGIIDEILVQEGSEVEENQVLFRLSNTRADADRQEIEIALQTLDFRRARLQAEINGDEAFEADKMSTGTYSKIAETESQLFLTRRAELNEKLDGLKRRAEQKVLKLDDLQTTIQNLKKERSVAQEQLQIKQRLRNSGAISRSQYLEAESQVQDFNTRIARIEKEIPITKSELSETTNLIEETKQSWKSKAIGEMNETRIEMRKLEERLRGFTDTFNRTEIISPVKGLINRLSVNTVGGVVAPGQVLAEIIPIEETLIVEGRISTNDRGKIWPGLDVVTHITAYDYTIYGGLNGKLVYISPDSFIDGQEQEYYKVRVAIERVAMGGDNPIYPGMSVNLNILSGKVSVLQALLRPLKNIRENALREL